MESIDLLRELRDKSAVKYREALSEAINAIKVKDFYIEQLNEELASLDYEARMKKCLALHDQINDRWYKDLIESSVDVSKSRFEKF